MKIILASASPRRKELLEQLGLTFLVFPAQGEEKQVGDTPSEIVMNLAKQKAGEIYKKMIEAKVGEQDSLVIGADTVVAVGNEILGKPGTPMRAYEMIGKLQGRTHQVYTGVTVLLCLEEGRTHGITFAEKTDVHVYPMTPREMSEYAECGEPLDKAGAYGIQGRFAAYIKGIDGDYANVVGLPLGRLNQEIKGLLEDREDD